MKKYDEIEQYIDTRHKNMLNSAINYIDSLNKEEKDIIKSVILYGSCARGMQKFNSDIDLAVIVDKNIDDSEKTREKIRAIKGMQNLPEYGAPEIQVRILMDEWENRGGAFYDNIKRNGVVIW